MKLKKLAYLAVIAGVSVAVIVPLATAQPPADGKRSPAAKKERRAKMKAKRAEFFRKDLGLTDAKATQVETTLDSYRKRGRAIRKAQKKLMGQLNALLNADSDDNSAYDAILKGMANNKAQAVKIKQARGDYVRKALTPKQQAIMMVRMRQMKKRMRRMRGGKRGGRGGGPAGF